MNDVPAVALVVAASSVPAFVLARTLAADRPRLARWVTLAGLAMLAGAAGLWWAGDSQPRALAVMLGMVLAVNGAALVIALDVVRGRGGKPPGPGP